MVEAEQQELAAGMIRAGKVLWQMAREQPDRRTEFLEWAQRLGIAAGKVAALTKEG